MAFIHRKKPKCFTTTKIQLHLSHQPPPPLDLKGKTTLRHMQSMLLKYSVSNYCVSGQGKLSLTLKSTQFQTLRTVLLSELQDSCTNIDIVLPVFFLFHLLSTVCPALCHMQHFISKDYYINKKIIAFITQNISILCFM